MNTECWRNDTGSEKTAEPGEKFVLVPLSQPQISHGQKWNRTPVPAVTAQYSVQGDYLASGWNPAEAVGFFWCPNNPQHAFLRRGSERICPMSQLCGM